MVLPPFSIPKEIIDEIKRQTKDLLLGLSVKGLANIQFAVKDNEVFLIEVNPRASRTVPFVSKSIGVPLAKLGTKIMIGKKLKELGFSKEIKPKHYSVKESVFPFIKFVKVDTILGPEMKSTGEVMGIDPKLDNAFAKAQIAAGNSLPLEGVAFISVKDEDKNDTVLGIAKKLTELDFKIILYRRNFKLFNKKRYSK